MTSTGRSTAHHGGRPPWRRLTPVGWTAGEVTIIGSVQGQLLHGPLPMAARVASTWGEHAGGWLATAGVAALLDVERRELWVRAGATVFGAHAAAVILKRVVRRRRPHDARVRVLAPTPSALSFPSAHAASTTAFALAAAPVIGHPAAAALVGAMAVSRVLLGVHYPTDVLAGVAVGLGSYVALRRVPIPWSR